jgi:hypothetical protein
MYVILCQPRILPPSLLARYFSTLSSTILPFAQYIDTFTKARLVPPMWPPTWRRNPPPSPRPSPCVKGPKRRVLQPLTRPLACITHVRQATPRPRHPQRKSIAWDVGVGGMGQKNPHAEKTACRHACSQRRVDSKTCRNKNIATLRSTIVDQAYHITSGIEWHYLEVDRPLHFLLINITTYHRKITRQGRYLPKPDQPTYDHGLPI